MATIALIGLERPAAEQICSALEVDRHQIIRYQQQDNLIRELRDVHIVFAGGEPAGCLSLLRRVRKLRPTMPFIVVPRTLTTIEWLKALEAGATDYCSAPIDAQQVHWIMETVSGPAAPRIELSGIRGGGKDEQ